MILKAEKDILELIERDQWMMDILYAAKALGLPDWWICAGFVRAKIWDTLHGFTERTDIPDIDVIYFDKQDLSKSREKELEQRLKEILPAVPWSVKNEARMHLVNHFSPYSSSVDAISKFPETATALGAKLDENGRLQLTAPCGIEDVIGLKVKPTAFFAENKARAAIYEERLLQKNWKTVWNQIEIYHIDGKEWHL
ncbi:nucleotidyltransferase family protein [Bacillus canaveralius]|uniref:nucleotidyltransferase family protein n=1 Tax=Bacillus canaveralius TaxID=1403243 RepID=UPI000F7936FD|nr:nucleotidyltransferase family protein [Bacillus canaveralius]RSK52074.1 nucleotidyltransferase family protein [Bacillus canaveralius]